MIIVWIIVAIAAIGVFVGILALLGFGIHGDERERRVGLTHRRRRARRDAGHTTGV